MCCAMINYATQLAQTGSTQMQHAYEFHDMELELLVTAGVKIYALREFQVYQG